LIFDVFLSFLNIDGTRTDPLRGRLSKQKAKGRRRTEINRYIIQGEEVCDVDFWRKIGASDSITVNPKKIFLLC
jgi:hypothetical protein